MWPEGWFRRTLVGGILIAAVAVWVANVTGVTRRLGEETGQKNADDAAWVEQQMLKQEHGRRLWAK